MRTEMGVPRPPAQRLRGQGPPLGHLRPHEGERGPPGPSGGAWPCVTCRALRE